MSVNLATAYVTLTPTTKGIGKAIDDAFAPAERSAEQAGEKSGNRLTSALGGALKKGALAVGVAAGGVLSTALFKGWNRLTNIENAQAKLSGLGHSAESVKSIMDNALASVKGTAFGLDEAATIAAGAVASGIKPGQDLQRTLGLVGDAATIGGTSMAEMGAIFNKVAASGKIQGDVIAQLGDKGIPILQLLGKQLGKTPEEVAKLASQGKVDFATFQAAMEDGLGGAALKSGETTQGAFKNMGAALSRFGAQLLTDVFPLAKTVFGGITGLLDGLGAKVGPVAETVSAKLGPAFERAGAVVSGLFSLFAGGDFTGGLGKALGVEEDSKVVDVLFRIRDAAMGFFDGLRSALPAVIAGAKDLWATFGPLAVTIGQFAIGALVVAFEKLGPAVSAVGSAFQSVTGFLRDHETTAKVLAVTVLSGVAAYKAYKATVALVKGVQLGYTTALKAGTIAENARTTATKLGALAAKPQLIATKAMTAATKAWTAVQWLFNAAMRANPIGLVVTALIALVAGLVLAWKKSETFRNVVIGVFEKIKGAVSAAVSWIAGALSAVWSAMQAGFSAVAAVVTPIIGGIVTAFEAVGAAVAWVWGSVLKPVFDLWMAVAKIVASIWLAVLLTPIVLAVQALGAVFSWLYNSVIKPVWSGISAAVGLVVAGLKLYFDGVMTVVRAMGAVFSWLYDNVVKPVWNGIKAVISAVVSAIAGFVVGTWNGIVAGVSAAMGAISSAVSTVWNGIYGFVSGIVSKVAGVIRGAFDTVAGAISGVFSGLGSTIGSVFDKVVSAVKSAVNGAIGLINKGIGFINSKLIATANKVPFVNIPNVPDIPMLAEGGVVTGPTLAMVGEGRESEAVLPLSKLDAMLSPRGDDQRPIELKVYPRQEIDIPALARQVARELAWGTT